MDDLDAPAPDYELPMRSTTGKVLPATLGRMTLIHGIDEILPGLRVRAASGHTSSHIFLDCERDFDSLEHPDWRFVFDLDAEQAGRTRRMLLNKANARANLHAFRGLYSDAGRADRSGTAFRLRPVAEAVQ